MKEREAQTISLIAEIKYNNGFVKYKDTDKELIVLREKRININSKLKIRGVLLEYKASLCKEKVIYYN